MFEMFEIASESTTESIFMLIYITYKSQLESSGECRAGEKLEGHLRRIHWLIRKKDTFIVIIRQLYHKIQVHRSR